MKIAIIDSGVDSKDPYIFNSDIVNLASNGRYINFHQGNMHGTYVTRILTREIQSKTEILSIKVLNKDNYGRKNEFCDALKICLEQDVQIVNISLGVQKNDLFQMDEIIDLCDRAMKKGIIIIAAYHNSGIESYPACLSNVIGVKTCETQMDFISLDSERHDIAFCHNHSMSMDCLSSFINGNSFLAPIIAGTFYMYFKKIHGDINQFFSYLEKECGPNLQKNFWVHNSEDLLRMIRKKNVAFYSNVSTSENDKILCLIEKYGESCRINKTLDLALYAKADVIFIGEVSFLKGLRINDIYDFAKRIALMGKDILMLASYVSMWDRIRISKQYSNKIVSFYF